MKILLINNYSHRKGGAESVFFNSINLLKERGHDVISFAIKSNQSDSFDVGYSIQNSKLSLNKFYSFEAKKVITEILIKEKPDLVHLHNIIGGITFSILPVLKKFSVPIVATIHDFRLLCPTWVMINGKGEICEKCKTRKYYQCVFNRCHPDGYIKSFIIANESYLRDLFFFHQKYFDAYIFVSNFSREKFLEFYPELITKNLYVNYNYVNDFSNEIVPGEYFLYFGRLDREKGIKTLIEAFKNLPELKLKIAGRGELEDFLLKNKIPNIDFVGFKQGEELKNLIKNSFFVIVPSECYENLPLTVVESLAMSKPIITTNLGVFKEICRENFNGFRFEPKNINALIKVLKKTSNLERENYIQLSENAYNFAIQNFHSDNHYRKLIDVYQNTLEANKKK